MTVFITWITGAGVGAQTVVYVDADAGGANSGSNWCDAYHDLQDALRFAASDSEVTEIRVAQGVYWPDRGIDQTLGHRAASFHLISGVAVRGGYAGCGAPDPDARDLQVYETVLSGDLGADDNQVSADCCVSHPGPGCSDADCEIVVCWSHPECCDGEWNDLCAYSAQRHCCTVCKKCDNAYNVTTGSDTGLTAVLDGFTITAGHAADDWHLVGAGLYNVSGSPTVSDCVFTGNFAWEDGAGVGNLSNSDPAVSNCLFTNNRAGSSGGGIYNWAGSDPIVTGCTFTGNAARSGGAVANRAGSEPEIDDCVFRNNAVSAKGGAICNYDSNPSIVNSVFHRNSAGDGGGVSNMAYSYAMLQDCAFSGNWASTQGGGIYNHDSLPTLINCTLSNNWAETAGGIYAYGTPTLTINGCGNYFPNSAEVPSAYRNSLNLISCILWRNWDDGGMDVSAQITANVQLVVDYSCIQGWLDGMGGTDNTRADPEFVDADGPDGIPGTEDDNVRLRSVSPGINAGDPAFEPEPDETDLDGGPRLLCGRVDMGAYEFGLGDYTCDRNIDLADLAHWQACMTGPDTAPSPDGCEVFDFQYDGDVDLGDYRGFQSALTIP